MKRTGRELIGRAKIGRFLPWALGVIFLGHLVTLSPCHRVTVSAAEPNDPIFLLQTASGPAASGPLQELGEQWRVRLGGPNPVHTEADDLLELRRVGRRLPPLPEGEQLVFVNGDRVPGTALQLVGERLVFRPHLTERSRDDKPVAVPVSAVSVLWLADPETDHPGLLRRRLAAGRRPRDLVYLRNGDTIEGTLTDLNEQSVAVEIGKEVMTLPRGRVAVIAFNTELTSSLRPRGPYGRLVLVNGGRLSLASAACADGRTLTGTTLFKAPVRIPLDEVAALYVYQGRAVYLSDLKPLRYEYTSFLPTALPGGYVADGSFGGRDLRLGGNTHDKGLGMHSAGRLTYDLSGDYRRFEALVGLDDRDGRRGSVRVRVLVDGKPKDAGADRELTGGSEPLPLRVDVTGAKELTLVVEFGRAGDVEDHVNWADARLVR